eukprot:TRINITY_DN114867_c0_g1_i2.p1 TRINITY_DN114867_c0_g1~~TRINITY_DN114867_c0_g1_i2.p1  ORF type:complete len:176 (+),score=7.55 TRINITY_DN114867_c0_g1_i2:328-855(+)
MPLKHIKLSLTDGIECTNHEVTRLWGEHIPLPPSRVWTAGFLWSLQLPQADKVALASALSHVGNQMITEMYSREEKATLESDWIGIEKHVAESIDSGKVNTAFGNILERYGAAIKEGGMLENLMLVESLPDGFAFSVGPMMMNILYCRPVSVETLKKKMVVSTIAFVNQENTVSI